MRLGRSQPIEEGGLLMHLGTPLTLKSGDSLNPGGKGSRDV